MSYMFQQSAFNQDIAAWKTSNVIDFSSMFYEAPFNQDISDWNTANGVYFYTMFSTSSWKVHPFNQDLSGWNVGKACNLDSMFADSAFNQDLNKWGPLLDAKRCDDDTAPSVLSMFEGSQCPSTYITPILHHFCHDEIVVTVSLLSLPQGC